MKATLDKGPGTRSPGTNLKQIEPWIGPFFTFFFSFFYVCLSPRLSSSLVLFSLEWESIHRFLVNPNPLPLMKIDASTLHFLPHLPFYLHFVHLKKLCIPFFFSNHLVRILKISHANFLIGPKWGSWSALNNVLNP